MERPAQKRTPGAVRPGWASKGNASETGEILRWEDRVAEPRASTEEDLHKAARKAGLNWWAQQMRYGTDYFLWGKALGTEGIVRYRTLTAALEACREACAQHRKPRCGWAK
jgi:hypothetical protein